MAAIDSIEAMPTGSTLTKTQTGWEVKRTTAAAMGFQHGTGATIDLAFASIGAKRTTPDGK